jgi:large exoprotein involved in heme utilization and adhesion
VVEQDLSVINGGQISSSTHSAGAAGEVDIKARSLTVAGSGPLSSSTILSETNAAGDSGAVKVKVTGTLTIADGGAISSSTFGAGTAGAIDITTRSLVIDGHDTGVLSEASAESSGQAGRVSLVATDGITLRNEGRLSIRSHAVVAHPEALAPATLSVATPRIEMSQGGQITAETTGNVAAGSIEITAPAARALSITGRDGAQITSSTRLPRADELADGQLGPGPGAGTGNAGDVSIQAVNLTLSGVSVLSEAQSGTTGSAGTVKLSAAGNLSVLDNTRIATDTSGAGRAGDVSISARNLVIDPSEISSRAGAESSGQTGNVQVTATGSVTIADQSRLSIQNDADVVQPASLTPSAIIVTAPRIDLLGGQISAASSDNAAASNVQLNTAQLVMRNGAIATNAKDGNGGSIRIQSGGFVVLDHAQITTSVSGLQNGNGGDITVSTPVLAMDIGFIQANTQAALARGGSVVIDAVAIVANGAVLIGGDTPLSFNSGLIGLNVIQAAAPGGVSGSVAVSVPVLDIAGSLRGLSAETVAGGALARDLCRLGATSSFTPLGRGGLQPMASGLIRPELGNSATNAWHDRKDDARVAALADPGRLEAYRCR